MISVYVVMMMMIADSLEHFGYDRSHRNEVPTIIRNNKRWFVRYHSFLPWPVVVVVVVVV